MVQLHGNNPVFPPDGKVRFSLYTSDFLTVVEYLLGGGLNHAKEQRETCLPSTEVEEEVVMLVEVCVEEEGEVVEVEGEDSPLVVPGEEEAVDLVGEHQGQTEAEVVVKRHQVRRLETRLLQYKHQQQYQSQHR